MMRSAILIIALGVLGAHHVRSIDLTISFKNTSEQALGFGFNNFGIGTGIVVVFGFDFGFGTGIFVAFGIFVDFGIDLGIAFVVGGIVAFVVGGIVFGFVVGVLVAFFNNFGFVFGFGTYMTDKSK